MLLLGVFLLTACNSPLAPPPADDGTAAPPPVPTISAPQITPDSGAYSASDTISISVVPDTAVIYYTTDGSDPDESSAVYSAPLPMMNGELRAIAKHNGYQDSAIVSRTYTIDPYKTALPQSNVSSGSYTSEFSVTLTSATAGAVIYYTTNATDPDTSSSVYSGPISINSTTELRAMALNPAVNWTQSDISSYTFTMQASPVVFSVSGGDYGSSQTVSLSSATPSGSIRYTTDGSDPGVSTGSLYSGSISVDVNTEIRAISYRTGWSSSSIASENYNLVYSAVPSISLAAGDYLTGQVTTLSVPSDATSVRYTLDGSNPTETHGILYSGGDIIIDDSLDITIKAAAFRSGWSWSGSSSTAAYHIQLPSTRDFYAQHATTLAVYTVSNAQMLAYTDHGVVYAETGHGITAQNASDLLTEFENNIYGLIRTNYGVESDVDANGRILMLLLDIQDDYNPVTGGGYVAGYFSPYDTLDYSDSNKADMLFMDVNPAVPNSAEFYGTIAHEFQHLVNFNAKYLEGGGSLQDTWINEGLSLSAEYLYTGAQVQSRIDYFNDGLNNSIQYGNNFYIWDDTYYGDVLADYSTAYLFFQWLRIHADNDTGIYGDVFNSTYTDYRAVVQAVGLRLDDYVSAPTWSTILGDWLLANILNASTGLWGYENEISTYPVVFNSTGGSAFTLIPGASLLVATDGSDRYSPLTSPYGVRYIGIDFTNTVLDATGPTYDGEYILSYNSLTGSMASNSLTVYLPSVVNGMSSMLSTQATSDYELPHSYPVSVQFGDPSAGRGTAQVEDVSKSSLGVAGALR